MEDFYQDFINGEEIKMIKNFLASISVTFMVGAILGYLILLDLLPRFTLFMSVNGVVALFAAHFFRKWTNKP